jgi:PAS domain S-box-containing protein
MEEELPASEEIYHLHFEHTSDVVVAVDPEFKVVNVSPSVDRLVGYRPEELIGRSFQDLDILAPESLEAVVSDAMRVLTGERIVASKVELIAKDGSRRFAEASVTPVVHDGEVVALAAIVRDITERVQLEEALKIHQNHLEMVVDERTAKLARLNEQLQQEILDRKQAQETLQRRSRELEFLNRIGQALNSSLNLDQVLNTILEETRDLLAATACSVWLIEPGTDELVCQQAVGLGSDIVRGWRLAPGEGLAGQVARTGESLIVPDTRAEDRHFKGVDQQVGTELRSILVLPLRSKDAIMGVIQVLHTETDRFVKENLTLLELLATSAAISIQNAQLYQDLREQMHMLKEVQAVLVRNEKMTALGRLAASIAHEINNPLQSMQNSMLLLREELEGNRDPDEIDYCLGVTDDGIDRIAAIVHRMREFYWTERQSKSLPYPDLAPVEDFYRLTHEELQAIDVRALLEDVLRLTNKQFQHSDVAVECNWAKNLPLPQGNPDYLKQVFLNLTLNAIDAMAAQGGTFLVRTGLDQIQREDGQLQPAVRIELSDTGEGILPEVLPRLFEPFLTTKAHGSGFGLFTSYKIIEAHEGQIDVESQVGLGTTFRILLPAKPA